ncbi:MAG: ABC transporter permease [Pirellulales bacterium]|nr:ABC transporter permease [Pirellulales bacterium]
MRDPTRNPSAGDRSTLLGWTVVPAVLLAAWYVGAAWIDRPWLYPSPARVAEQLLHPLRDHFGLGSLAGNTLVSLVRVVLGFAVAVVFGVVLGLLLGCVRTLRGWFEPCVEILRPLCPIAWLPFAIAVFKLETVPQVFGVAHSGTILDHVQLGMIFILFWGGFFPIFTCTLDGVCGVRRNYISLARLLGAGRLQRFVHVYLPASLPMILTGFRQGIGTCWFVIIAAEMLPGSDSGIGYLLMYAADLCAMDVVIASMIIIGVIGALLNFAMRAAMRTFLRWHGKEI